MNDKIPSEEFTDLIERARDGDDQALAELAKRYEPEVRVAARVLLGPLLRPHVDSMDLVQSIHRHILIGLRRDKFEISTPSQLLALVLTMVKRKAAQHARRLGRRQRLANEAVRLRIREATELSGDDPARDAQYKDLLRQYMVRLDATDRRVVELRLQGHTTAEAAREMGLDPDALRVRLSRLRKKLGGVEASLARWI
ncbi:RNA polymerase sigma factor [Singulisphaera sp. PoT]|uniref:RNA polymerase sigma factor n=1 Tax=Singulisphaera sp. PoT TaxID=3411797 RepID=UPI003BF532F2